MTDATNTGSPDPAALVSDALASLAIAHEIIEIDPDFADTAQFCEKYGYPPERSANTLLIASKKGPEQYCVCVVLASTSLDVNKRVRKLMGVRRVSFASAEQTIAVTGMMIGGVTPFGLPGDVPIYVDDAIDGLDYVILGSGSRSTKVKMPGAEFAKVPGVEFISELAVVRKSE
jgi:prolyl-tRNA editing enzyme YbaK/EbsC (Cys-tRNA(Pro) deacylase)